MRIFCFGVAALRCEKRQTDANAWDKTSVSASLHSHASALYWHVKVAAAGAFLLVVASLFIPCARSQPAASMSSFALRDGDRVLFYGDSITAQRLYTRYMESITVSRYPRMRIHFYNAGVGGDTVEGGRFGDMETRVKRDVVPRHPTVVTVMLGANDGRYTLEHFEENRARFAAGYRKLLHTLRQSLPGVRLYLIISSPYDEIAHKPDIPGYNSVVVALGEFVKQLGREEGIPVVDFNTPVNDALRKATAINGGLAATWILEGVHPSAACQWIMAAALARAWGVDPTVSDVHLDGQQKRVTRSQNASVSDIHWNQNGVAWTETDGSLPLPLLLDDGSLNLVLQSSDLAAIDREILTVTGLSGDRYSLTIDGTKIAEFTRRQLDSGVNLALYNSPIEGQANTIEWTTSDRAQLSNTWYQLMSEDKLQPDQQSTAQGLETLDAELIEREYRAAQPLPHTFELVSIASQ